MYSYTSPTSAPVATESRAPTQTAPQPARQATAQPRVPRPTDEPDDALVAAGAPKAPAPTAVVPTTAPADAASSTAPVTGTMVAADGDTEAASGTTPTPAISPEEQARMQAALRQAQARMGRAKVQYRLAAIAQAEKELRVANDTFKQAQNTPPKPEDLARADAAVRDAEANLKRVQDAKAQQADPAALQAALNDAQTRLRALGAPADAKAIAAAQAQVGVEQQNFERVAGAASARKTSAEQKVGAASTGLRAAQQAHAASLGQLQQAQAGIDPKTGKPFEKESGVDAAAEQQSYAAAAAAHAQSVQDAQAALDQARAAYAAARQQEIDEDAVAQAALDAARADLARVSQGAKPEDVAAARAQVDQARAALGQSQKDFRASSSALAQAQAQLDAAKTALDKLKQGGNRDQIAAAQKVVDQAKQKLAWARQSGLGRGGWTWPTFGTITSGFGLRDMKVGRFHNGVDVANGKDTPIGAARDGVVVEAGWCAGYGYCVKLRHAGGFTSEYGHLDQQPPVTAGQSVSAGTMIGHMGTTYDPDHGGYSTGVHLHFTIKRYGAAVDPLQYLP